MVIRNLEDRLVYQLHTWIYSWKLQGYRCACGHVVELVSSKNLLYRCRCGVEIIVEPWDSVADSGGDHAPSVYDA